MNAPLRALQGQGGLVQRELRERSGERDEAEIGGEVAAPDRLSLVLQFDSRAAPLPPGGVEAPAELVGREYAGREDQLVLLRARDGRIDPRHVYERIVAREPDLAGDHQAVPPCVVHPEVAEHGEAVTIFEAEVGREAEDEQSNERGDGEATMTAPAGEPQP